MDFDGNRVFDKDITRILRYGDDPTADDPNVLIAMDKTGQLYIIDTKGNITKND